MVQTIVSSVIAFITSGLLGYTSRKLVEYKNTIKKKAESENIQNLALKSLLKGQLTNIYFIYSETETIPDYAYQNFLDMLKVYEGLDGDGFIHTIAKKMENWKIISTDILK